LLSFVFIYFSESGLFNRLRAKKIKKSRFHLRLYAAAAWSRFASRRHAPFSLLSFHPGRPALGSAIKFAITDDDTADFGFTQENVGRFYSPRISYSFWLALDPAARASMRRSPLEKGPMKIADPNPHEFHPEIRLHRGTALRDPRKAP
jgi:hypothetical protein